MRSTTVYLLLLTIFNFVGITSFGQDSLIRNITLDNFSLVASSEFNINLFIKRVKEDTSFYQAFKNYNYYEHTIKGNISVLNRKDNIRASESITAIQKTKNKKGVSKLKWQNQTITAHNGRLRNRKGKYKFTTAEMYYETFFPKDTLVVSNHISSIQDEYVDDSKISQHKHDLKIVMFNPGSDVKGIPIIGKKMSIFDADMIRFYDYKISKRTYQKKECYVFSCIAKPEFRADKTVIKHLETYFDVESMLVIKREYNMKYNSILFQFDVDIKVVNEVKNDIITPKTIIYDGKWNIPLKSSEKFHFDLTINR